ncbi:hypothetical protein SAMN05720606_106160 [Paenibacillus polysaccharolyticus]|uniref:DUF2798 domain-containing protein n=2 Tax=Paenibacillus polysaccharolyticus TaxID=582692 RepID=A0A1G5H3Y4_9BACL|nr:hypothetical protein SAMN05720606_106160 [Paenibacillus polysaccharolyticus]
MSIMIQVTERMSVLPVSKKQQVIFGLMMCTGMVVVMMTFNLWHTGMLSQMSVPQLLLQFVICFAIAFLVESFIVGPIARKITFSFSFARSSKIKGVVTMSFLMVIGMVLLMSLYGIITAYTARQLEGDSVINAYLHTIVRNFGLALPYQLIVLGPLVRYVFGKLFKGPAAVASV